MQLELGTSRNSRDLINLKEIAIIVIWKITYGQGLLELRSSLYDGNISGNEALIFKGVLLLLMIGVLLSAYMKRILCDRTDITVFKIPERIDCKDNPIYIVKVKVEMKDLARCKVKAQSYN